MSMPDRTSWSFGWQFTTRRERIALVAIRLALNASPCTTMTGRRKPGFEPLRHVILVVEVDEDLIATHVGRRIVVGLPALRLARLLELGDHLLDLRLLFRGQR